MKKCLVLSVLLLCAASVWAADLSGKWSVQLTNPNGQVTERVFDFQVAAGKLSGTVTNFNVAPATFEQAGKPLMSGILKTQNGKVNELVDAQLTGDDISFTINGMMAGNQVKLVYTGKLTGDVLKLKLETKIPEGAKTPGGAPMNPPAPQDLEAKRIAK